MIDWLKIIGEKASEYFSSALNYLSNLGIDLTSFQSKLFSFVIILGLALAIIKIATKPIKWLFVILLGLLAISIGISFIP